MHTWMWLPSTNMVPWCELYLIWKDSSGSASKQKHKHKEGAQRVSEYSTHTCAQQGLAWLGLTYHAVVEVFELRPRAVQQVLANLVLQLRRVGLHGQPAGRVHCRRGPRRRADPQPTAPRVEPKQL